VQETLAAAMPKTMAALGHFANDGEIKVRFPKCNVTTHRSVGLGRGKGHEHSFITFQFHFDQAANESCPSPQVLLKSFVANLKCSSPTIRRTAASSAVSVCQQSRRPSYFYTWLLNVLLGRTTGTHSLTRSYTGDRAGGDMNASSHS